MPTSTPARGATRRGRGTAQRTVRTTASLTAFVLTTGLALVPALSASAATAAKPKAVHMPTVKSVTLVTGDVVRVTTAADGRKAVTLQPRPDGTIPQAAISEVHGHLYVVPTEAFGLLAANRLDRRLFDVTELIEDGYDDASRDTLPVMVDYGKGATAASEAKGASLDVGRAHGRDPASSASPRSTRRRRTPARSGPT